MLISKNLRILSFDFLARDFFYSPFYSRTLKNTSPPETTWSGTGGMAFNSSKFQLVDVKIRGREKYNFNRSESCLSFTRGEEE